MVWIKKHFSIFFLLSFVLSVLVFYQSSIGSYCSGSRSVGDGTLVPESQEEAQSWIEEIWEAASTPNSSGWTFIDRAAYAMTNLVDREAAYIGMLVPSVGSNYYSYLRPALFQHWASEMYQAQVTPLEWYNQNMGINYKNNGNTEPTRSDVESIDYSRQVMQDCYNVTNNYIQENPLTYKEATIPSYTRLNTSQFSNYTVYKSVQEIIKNCNGYAIIQAPNTWDGSNSRYALMVTIPKETFEINFYGTVNGGVFTSVQMEHNWANVAQFYPSSTNGIKMYRFYPNQAPVEYPNSGGNYWPSYNLVYNLASIRNGTGQGNIMTSLPKDETVYVFSTLNAYKNYNSGSPQPYYLGSGYDSYIPANTNISVSSPTTQQYYNNVVNNVQSGWTADQVLDLVDKVIGTGGGSGSGGSGSGSSDNPFSFLGTIGEAVGKLVGGIGDFIAQVVGGIVDAILDLINMFVGEDGILNKLTSLINTGFNTFLGDMFSWLPSEVVTCFTACLLVGIFFAIWKIIRG